MRDISTPVEVFDRLFSMAVCANDGATFSRTSTCIWLAEGMTLEATCSEGTDVCECESEGSGDEGKVGLTVLALAADEGERDGEETAS